MRSVQSYPGVWMLEPSDRHAFVSKLEVTADSIKAGDTIIHPYNLKPARVRSVNPVGEKIQITFDVGATATLQGPSIVALVQSPISTR